MCERGSGSNNRQEETFAGLLPSACFLHNQTLAPAKILHTNLELWGLICVLSEIIHHLHSTSGTADSKYACGQWDFYSNHLESKQETTVLPSAPCLQAFTFQSLAFMASSVYWLHSALLKLFLIFLDTYLSISYTPISSPFKICFLISLTSQSKKKSNVTQLDTYHSLSSCSKEGKKHLSGFMDIMEVVKRVS